MKAQTLSICMPGTACDKKCPYCVSKMTWAPEINVELWTRNLEMVRNFARNAQVTDIVITGKGEPILKRHLIDMDIIPRFKDWPLVLQTNGKSLAHDVAQPVPDVNVLAVSIDDPRTMAEYVPLWDKLAASNIIPRITVMLTEEVCAMPFRRWISVAKQYGIRQLSFRQITIPEIIEETTESTQAARWIQFRAANRASINMWLEDCWNQMVDCPVIRRLPYGAIIRDVDGVAVTRFEYCTQDENGDEDIRSLIYNQDGHLYTTWSSPASLIF